MTVWNQVNCGDQVRYGEHLLTVIKIENVPKSPGFLAVKGSYRSENGSRKTVSFQVKGSANPEG